MTKLPDARETDLAPEVPANHSDTRSAAIHLVNLLEVFELPDAPLLFAKVPLLVGKGSLRVLRFFDREFSVKRDFVVRQSFSRDEFFSKIERNPRFGFRFVLCEPFLQ